MEKGQIVRIAVTDVTEEGHGVGRTEDGMAVFVPKALPGDVIDAELTKVKKRWAQARLTGVLIPSPDRLDAYCPYDEDCGGCPLGRLRPEAESALSVRHVRDVLERIAGVEHPDVEKTVGMPEGEIPRYRNKAVIRVFTRPGEAPRVGFYARRSHRVVDCRDCRIQMEPAVAIAGAVREFLVENMTDHSVKGGNKRGGEEREEGRIESLMVRSSVSTGEVMAVLTCSNGRPQGLEKLVYAMDDAVNALAEGRAAGSAGSPERAGAAGGPDWSLESVYLDQTRPGKEPKLTLLAGSRILHDRIGPAKFEISPRAFWQVNARTTEKLYEKIFEYADLQPGAKVLDVYCGVGSIGIYLSKRMEDRISLAGFEVSEDAVRDANRNAVINGIVHARYFTGTAETVLPKLLEEAEAGGAASDGEDGLSPTADREAPDEEADVPPAIPVPDLRGVDCVILDPPRAGCDEALLRAVAEDMKPERIVYVSCELGTMARDVGWLTENGYAFGKAAPVAMFPATGRVESVVLLTRKDFEANS